MKGKIVAVALIGLLFAGINSGCVRPQIQPVPDEPKLLVIGGFLYEDGEVRRCVWFYGEGTPTDFYVEGEADYTCELLSRTGEVLYKLKLPDLSFDFETPSGRKQEPFGFTVVYPKGTAKVVLKHGDEILEEVKPSKYPPVITLGPVTRKGKDTHNIKWKANDRDGKKEDVNYLILYSDDRARWRALTSYLGVYGIEEFEFDTSKFDPGTYWIKIIATDKGFNTVEVMSEPFEIEE